MIRFTYVARVTDGLMLVASVDSSTSGRDVDDDKLQADGRQILRTLTMRSPKQCTFEGGAFSFHYLMEGNVCYLVLMQRAYPKRLAFLYLSELHSKFVEYLQAEHGQHEWEQQLATVDRPYAYIKFDKQIQRLRKEYSDPNSRQTNSKLSMELNDVNNIMKRNIQDVLDRGERISKASEASSKLVNDSKIFRSNAVTLNRMAFYRKWAPVAFGSVVVMFFFYLRFYIL
mmetsp:Transcript_1010/g.1505  ORF Transcript_1010/g.1505 Transcript_1010/m.1505 type:complete len:228 (-) Transcript_1010:62-745(-)